MFERFARETQQAVRRATELSRLEGAALVQAEHLLRALVDPVRDPVGQSLVDSGITATAIQAARTKEFRSALATVGIHTDRPAPPPAARLRRGRTAPFAPSARLALERAEVSAIAEGNRRISNKHLLEAIVTADAGRTPEILEALGTTPAEILERAGSASSG